MDKIKIFSLGGIDEAGKTLVVVEINQDIFVIDAGKRFPDKTTPGIDCIIPNTDYLHKNKNRIKAYLLSHGHHESIGGLPYFYLDSPAPVYCSRTTAEMLKELDKKMKRDPINYDFHIVKPSETFTVSGREISFFQTCHNMAESSGISIYTDLGNIVYSGDFICEYDTAHPAFEFDLPALANIAKRPTFFLMVDSFKADRRGYCAPNHRYYKYLNEAFDKAKGRIFVGGYSSAIYALNEIVSVTLEHKKKLACFDSETEKVLDLFTSLGSIQLPATSKIRLDDITRVNEKDLVILKLGDGGALFDCAKAIAERKIPDSRLHLKEGDVFFMAATPTDSLEGKFPKVIDELFKTGANVYYYSRKQISSMHPRQDDIKTIVSMLRPKYYQPIRGSYSQMIDNAKLAMGMHIGLSYNNIFVVDNGTVLDFDLNGRVSIKEDPEVDASEVIVDGFGSALINSPSIKERLRMAGDGIILISGLLSLKDKSFIGKPDCQMRGFSFKNETEPLVKLVTGIYIEEILQAFNENRYSKDDVIQRIKERISRTLRKNTRRNPKVVPTIFEM